MILVTGATGYLGKKIIDKLEHSEVIGISRTGRSACARHVNCDILDLAPDAIPEPVSTIIHTAAVKNSKSRDLFSTNIAGTGKVIEFAKAKNINHVIFISSSCTQLEKKNRYALSKVKAEELVVSSGLPYTIIRPNYIYGPGNSQFRLIVSMVKKFKIIPVIGNGMFKIAPVYEEDLVEAIVSCIKNKKAYNKSYSICGEEMTFNEFLYAIASSQNLNRRLFHINERLIFLATYLYDKEFTYPFQNRFGNYTDAAEDLRFKPIKFIKWLLHSMEEETRSSMSKLS